MILKNVVILCALCVFVSSCSKKRSVEQSKLEDDKAELLEVERRIQKQQQELLVAKEKEEARKLEEKAVEERFLEEKRLAKEKESEAERQLALEKEKQRLEIIAEKQKAQKLALNEFLDKEFDELKLLNGKTLRSAKVSSADPVKLSFIHKNGVTTVSFADLPEEIRRACKYDKELEILELVDRKAKEELAMQKKSQRSTIKKNNQSRNLDINKNDDYGRIKGPEKTKDKKVIRPKGVLSVRVVGTSRGRKTIEVIAKSNIDATLYLNDYWRPHRVHRVSANQVYRHTWRNVNTKYDVKLIGNGKILDRESSGRKSGLGGQRGL